jgi:Nif-specific regulatory protein
LTQFDLDLLTVVAHQTSTVFDNLDLIERLNQAQARLQTENTYLKEVLKRDEVSVSIIGDSSALKKVLHHVEVVARTNTTVLLLGETGTGKELFARYLHEAGPRRENLFAAVNCGALAESLLESELFGHKKGAFTGAWTDREGLFQVADGGTLFLDEVGDVSPSLQVKLLRALENGEVTPVGAVHPIKVDVRIVAATNKDLSAEVASGRFREDLFYRINVFPVRLPPLRERTGDVPILARFFLERFNERLGKRITGISPACMERLRAYHWPGNVRELQNELERAVLLSDDGAMVDPEALSERISGMLELPVEIGPLKETMARLEEQYILRALKEHDNNRTHTARTLGISRQALTVKLNRYGLTGRDA